MLVKGIPRNFTRDKNGLPFIAAQWQWSLQWYYTASLIHHMVQNRMGSSLIWVGWITCTMWCHYNTISFLPNPHKRHPIACPWWRVMGCLLWVQPLIKFCHNHCSAVYIIYIGLHHNGTQLYYFNNWGLGIQICTDELGSLVQVMTYYLFETMSYTNQFQ